MFLFSHNTFIWYLRIVYEINAIMTYLYGLPSTMVTYNKQLVHRPYIRVGHDLADPIFVFYT